MIEKVCKNCEFDKYGYLAPHCSDCGDDHRYFLEKDGNQPIKSVAPKIAEDKLKKLLREVYKILSDAPELNMSNYDETEVKNLNDKMVEAYCLLNYEQSNFSV